MTHSPFQTIPEPLQSDAIAPALERLLNSEAFRKSSNLRHLLRYLVMQTLEGHPEQIKESVIAIEVFSRRDDFDGRLDNIVRVQAHRLRKLLEAYYAGEGSSEPVRISIPRGSYVPQFEILADGVASPEPEPLSPLTVELDLPVKAEPLPAPAGRNKTPLWIALAFVTGAFVSFGVAARLLPGGPPRDVPGAVREIWQPVFASGVPVIASYSSPSFLRVEHSPLFLMYGGPLSAAPGAEFDPGPTDPYIDRSLIPKGQRLHFSDGWTGTGEVLAVNRLSWLGARFQNPLTATPSRLLPPNELHRANVVFIGSPSSNGLVPDTALQSRPFVAANNGEIRIRDPRPGELPSYSNVLNPKTGEVVAGYVLFSVLPGRDPNHMIVCSSGLSTAATWMGIDFTTTDKEAEQLTGLLKAANGGRMPRYYQAIIRAEFFRGAPSRPTLVAVRKVQ
jgi:hypothetical protein